MAKLDDITLGNWQVFRTNLTGVAMPYYNKIATVFSDTEKGVGKTVKEQQERMSAMLGLLARMEGRGETPITRKELKRLDELNVEFRKTHKQVAVWVKECIPLREGSEKVVKDIGISPEEMKTADAVSKRPGLGRRGLISQLSRSLGLGTAGLGVATAGAVVRPMLGPLAAPTLLAAGLGYGAYRMARGAIRRRGARVAGGDVPSARAAGMPRATGMPGAAGGGVVEGLASTYPRDVRGRFVPRAGLTGIDNIEKGLFKFFDKRALKAKWTRRLLRAIEKGAGRGGPRGLLGAGLLGSFSKLKLLLPGVLLAFGKIAGLAGAIAFTGYQLYRVGGAAKELWEVHKNVAEHTKKMLQKQIGFLEKFSVTLMKKAQKAAAEGDEETRKKAVAGVLEAQKEIFEKQEKPGLWKTWKRGAGALVGDVKGVTGFAEGGVVTRPTLGVIGEERPEVVTPLSAGNIMDVLKAIRENTAKGAGMEAAPPVDTFSPPFDLADPLLNQLNTSGSLSIG